MEPQPKYNVGDHIFVTNPDRTKIIGRRKIKPGTITREGNVFYKLVDDNTYVKEENAFKTIAEARLAVLENTEPEDILKKFASKQRRPKFRAGDRVKFKGGIGCIFGEPRIEEHTIIYNVRYNYNETTVALEESLEPAEPFKVGDKVYLNPVEIMHNIVSSPFTTEEDVALGMNWIKHNASTEGTITHILGDGQDITATFKHPLRLEPNWIELSNGQKRKVIIRRRKWYDRFRRKKNRA